MENKKIYMSMLFDFFGDLLTEKQREYFDLYYNEDLSLSEIGESAGISRQGVRDIIVRAEKTLLDLEKKTGVVRRFDELRITLTSVEADLRRIDDIAANKDISAIIAGLLNKTHDLKG